MRYIRPTRRPQGPWCFRSISINPDTQAISAECTAYTLWWKRPLKKLNSGDSGHRGRATSQWKGVSASHSFSSVAQAEVAQDVWILKLLPSATLWSYESHELPIHQAFVQIMPVISPAQFGEADFSYLHYFFCVGFAAIKPIYSMVTLSTSGTSGGAFATGAQVM